MFEMMPFGRHNRMSTFDPFREMEKFEQSFFGNAFGGDFKTDIQDQGDSYLLEADLPGVKKEDIAVDIDGDRLTISAQRSSQTEEKDDKTHYVRQERSYGSYSRSFDITGIKSAEIKGSYENGVLKLVLPKEAPTAPTSRRLNLE